MKFLLATGNEHKLKEFREIFSGTNIEIIGENELKNRLPDIIENGNTFEENALIKARSGSAFTGLPTIADDSGLCVDYLNGAPGVYSARFAGEHGNNAANNAKLLSLLNGVPMDKRTARFVCAIACVFPEGQEFTVRGECEGRIAFELSGSGGFGYDPLFISELGCFGEISSEMKNSISHRGAAIKKFKEKLSEYIKVE